MAWVALLRGVNVGGNSTVAMPRLKAAFEQAGMASVRTYINSGNVVFASDEADRARLVARLESAVEAEFGFPVKTLLRSHQEMAAVVDLLTDGWTNDAENRCDVVFSDEFTAPSSIELLPFTTGLEETRFVPGAIVWRLDRSLATKSRLTKFVGTPLYKLTTTRNANTVRKLLALLEAHSPVC